MTQTEKFLTGARCSQGSSDLAVFESCSMWPKIRQSKIIPVGFYFGAGNFYTGLSSSFVKRFVQQ